MVLRPRNIRIYFRFALSAFFVAWLSGLVFLVCCRQTLAATETHGFCPMAKMGGHCDRSRRDSAPSWTADDSGGECLAGCAYLPVIFDKSRKVDQAKGQPAAPASVILVKFTAPSVVPGTSPPITFQGRVRFDDRFLARNCILRI